jgi:hypothetical protein
MNLDIDIFNDCIREAEEMYRTGATRVAIVGIVPPKS